VEGELIAVPCEVSATDVMIDTVHAALQAEESFHGVRGETHEGWHDGAADHRYLWGRRTDDAQDPTSSEEPRQAEGQETEGR